ncbi:hypothetical protein PpBr36_03414, partial [Pyricularia pennisetigena]|uniref:hypothetical protein n=1 Tax=Pyricularia pennisetigena TaxID=1578925 RepID=UPI001150874B
TRGRKDMASPSLNSAFGSDSQDFDSVSLRQRLSKPDDFESWKKVVYERLRERGLSHVPLVPPAASDRERDARFQRRPTADELRRVTLMLKFSVTARVRYQFLGGPHFNNEKPWEMWSAILEWAGKRPEIESHGVSYTAHKPVRPRFLFDKLSSLLQSIATVSLTSFDSFEAYVARFNNLRKQLLDISCSLSEKQYIAFFIVGIKDIEEQQEWIRHVKEAMETNPGITLDWVLSINGANSRQYSPVPDGNMASRAVKEEENAHVPYEIPFSHRQSQPYHRTKLEPREGSAYDSYRPAYNGGRGKVPKNSLDLRADSGTQGRPRGKTAIDDEPLRKPHIRAQDDLSRADRPSIHSKPRHDNIENKLTKIDVSELLPHSSTGDPDEDNVSNQVRKPKLETAIDSNNSTAGEPHALSCAVGMTETIASQPPTSVSSKAATSTVKKVTFDDRPQSVGGAGRHGKSAAPVGQNTNKTSNIQIRGSSTASSSSPNQANPENIESNPITTSPACSRPSTMPQRRFAAAETEQSSSHIPARTSTTAPQMSKGQANASAPSPDQPLNGSRKGSPVTLVSGPKLPAAVTGGAVEEKDLVNTGSTSSPVLANADSSRSPKKAPHRMAQESGSPQKPRSDTPPVSKKRGLQDEPGKDPSTTGPPVKKRVSANHLMQSMLYKRRSII